MHILGTRVPRCLGVACSASSPKAAQALGCSLTRGLRISFGRVSCMARAASVPGLWTLGFLLLCGVCVWVLVAIGCGFRQPCQSWLGSWAGVFGYGLWCRPSSAGWGLWCVWLGLGFGLLLGRAWLRAHSACTPPFPVSVCGAGVRAGVWVSAAPRHSLGGVGVCVCSCARPARSSAPPGWGCCAGVCVCARSPLVPRLSRPGCAVWVCVLGPGLGCAPPFLVGLSGCDLVFFFGVSCFGFVVSVSGCPCPGPCGPCPPIPFLSGWVAGSFLFFFSRGVCLRALGVPFFGGPPFLAWCCRVWPGGPPVPLCGSCLQCLLGGGFGRLLWCWRAVWWLWAVFSPPPLRPCFFWGGGICLFLPLPSLGWRMHWSAFSVVFRVAVGGCVLLGRVAAPRVGWVMYMLGSVPLPAGSGAGSAGWAAAPGGFVRLWVRGLGLSESFLLRGAGFNLLGGPPPLLPGARWPRVWPVVPVCGVLVRRLPGCAVPCFG